MARREKSKLREMIEEYGIKDMNDVHEFVKMLTAETILYLATINIVNKRTMPVKEWGMILDNLMIYFGDRVKITL